MNATEAVELFGRLAEHPSIYREAIKKTVIPAIQALPPDQTVDYALLKSIPCTPFRKIGGINDAFSVIMGANEWLADHMRAIKEDNTLVDEIRTALQYTWVSTPSSPLESSR